MFFTLSIVVEKSLFGPFSAHYLVHLVFSYPQTSPPPETEKNNDLGGNTAHTLLMGGTIEVGTPYNIAKNRGTIGWDSAHQNSIICSYRGLDSTQNSYDQMVSFRIYTHFEAPSCKLGLARFLALLRIHDGALCGNIIAYS